MPNFHQWIERLALSTLVHVLFARRIGSGNGVDNDIEWNRSVDVATARKIRSDSPFRSVAVSTRPTLAVLQEWVERVAGHRRYPVVISVTS
jgi:hypothetical protein